MEIVVKIVVKVADYHNPKDAAALIMLMNHYSRDPMGGGEPLINIHYVIVLEGFRREGLSCLILEKVEEIAKKRDYCKITLEVVKGNASAQVAYRKFGFDYYRLNPDMGRALFWQKELSNEAS